MSEEVDVKPPVLLPVLKTEPIERPGSPESNCAICLEEFNNKSFTNSCLHEFCYLCLKEWSKIKPECPLCKQRFQTIIHNIRSPGDYDEYQVEANNTIDTLFLNLASHTSQRFPYSNALEFRERIHEQRELYPPSAAMTSMVLVRPATELIRHDSNIVSIRYVNDYNSNATRRRDIYRQNRWVRPAPSTRFRECSPEFYRLNPAQTHRLVPWLFRELHVLLDVTIDPNELLNCILQLIALYPIRSAQFRDALMPTMGTHTDHFIHEFYNFAISPHDIIGYDSVAEYDPPRSYFSSVTVHAATTDDDDSDVEIVQPMITKRSPNHESQCGLDLTNRAGPSSATYMRNDEVIEITDTSSDSEVEIIHVRPPTPVVITIDSTSEEEVLEVSSLSPLQPPEVERESWTPMPSTSRESTPPMPCLRPIRITRTRARKRHRTRTSSPSYSSSTSPCPSRSPSPSSSSSSTSSLSSTSSSSDSDYRHNRSSHRNKKRKRVSHNRKGRSKRRTKKCRVNIEDSSSSDE